MSSLNNGRSNAAGHPLRTAAPELAGSTGPPEGPPRLTPREQAIRDELALIDVHLAGLFEQGVRTFFQVERPGVAYILAHIGRELSLGVVDALAGQGIAGSQPATDVHTENENYPLAIGTALALPPSHPLVRAWNATYRELQGSTHYRRGRQAPSPDQVARAFMTLTEMLFGRIAPYFETQDELDALLEVEAPEPNHVAQLQRLLLRPTQRAYFFKRLKQVRWLKPLLDARLFAAPLDATADAAGVRYSWTGWPEGDYLARMATQDPQVVLQALKQIPVGLTNPIVWHNASLAARDLPPDLARELVPSFCRALDGPVLFLFPHNLIEVARRLALAGEKDAAFELAAKLTELDVRGGAARSATAVIWGHNEVVLKRIEHHHVEDLTERLFPALEQADPLRTLELLTKRTAYAIRHHRTDQETESPRDHSPIWCESLDHQNVLRNDLRSIFLVATAHVARRLAARGTTEAASVFSVLEGPPLDAFRRLQLYVLLEVGSSFPALVDAAVTDRSLIGGALGDREFSALLTGYFTVASATAREECAAIITAGPDRDWVREIRAFHLGRPPTDSEIAGYVQRWQALRIGWFGDRVPNELRRLANTLAPVLARVTLEKEEVENEASLASGERTESPLSPEELEQMDGTALAAYLETWTPSEGQRASPQGLANTVSELVAREPDWATALVAAIEHLPKPLYVQAVLEGLHQALRGGKTPPWAQALSLATRTVVRVSPDNEWRWAKREAARLVQEGASKDLLPFEMGEAAWAVVEGLHAADDTWLAEGDGVLAARPPDFQALASHAIGTSAGAAVDLALNVALWNIRGQRSGVEMAAQPRRVLVLLERALARDGGQAEAARVVIGQYLPWIMLIDEDWPLRNEGTLLTGNMGGPDWDPVWGGYLTRSRLFDNVFQKVRHWYSRSVSELQVIEGNEGARHGRDWSPERHLALHLVVGFVRGLAAPGEPDRLLEVFFQRAGTGDLARAYWALFRDFTDSEAPPASVTLQRLLGLWEWRLGELESGQQDARAAAEAGGLGWLFMIEAVPDDRALELLARTSRISNGQFEMTHSMWHRLSRVGVHNPASAGEVACLMIEAELQSEYPHFNHAEVAPVLQVGLSDASVRSQVVRVVHKLGEHGFTEFGNLR